MLVLNLPFKALMFLTLMRPSLVLFLVLWLKLVKDFLKVRCRLALLPFLISCLIWLDLVASLPLIKERIDRKSGSAGMPRPISYAVFCLKKKKIDAPIAATTIKMRQLMLPTLGILCVRVSPGRRLSYAFVRP